MRVRNPRNGDGKRRDEDDADGFNSPFRKLGASLRKRVSGKAVAGKRPEPDVGRPREPEPRPAATAPPPQPPVLSEAEAFAEATRGVARIQAEPRVGAKRVRGFDRIDEARRQELEEMAGAAGFDVSFDDHFVRGRAAGVSRETLSHLEKGGFPVAAHLDLHGMVLEDARSAVDDFLKEQQRLGRRCVLLVTGKGKNSPRQQGVLREKVPNWLARGPSARRVLAFVSARPCDGGVGALYVLMRSTSSRKNRIDVEFGGVGSLEP